MRRDRNVPVPPLFVARYVCVCCVGRCCNTHKMSEWCNIKCSCFCNYAMLQHSQDVCCVDRHLVSVAT